MSFKKTSKCKKKKDPTIITRDEIRKGYAQYYRNKRLIEADETYRSRKKTWPEESSSHYRERY